MPLVKSCSENAFWKNAELLQSEGKPRNQAFAIAFRTLRKACGLDPEAGQGRGAAAIVKMAERVDNHRRLGTLIERGREILEDL